MMRSHSYCSPRVRRAQVDRANNLVGAELVVTGGHEVGFTCNLFLRLRLKKSSVIPKANLFTFQTMKLRSREVK